MLCICEIKYLVTLLLFLFGINCLSQTPTANFSATPLEVCLGETITFTNSSSGQNIVTYNWNFGDGSTSQLENPTHIYTAPGIYTITLTVQTGSGDADAEVKSNYIRILDLPHPYFTINGNVCTSPTDITFSNLTNPPADLVYNWDFGNGQTSTDLQPGPVHYATTGNQTVTLSAIDTVTGCENEYTTLVTINNYQAAISGPAAVCKNSSAQYTANSSPGTNKWTWWLNGSEYSSQQAINHTFLSVGTDTIILVTQNTNSTCSDTVIKIITVNEVTVPDFLANDTMGCSPTTISFQNTVGAAGTYFWDFGDGQTSTDPNPSHTYIGNGSYDVQLIYTDNNGCTDSIKKDTLIDVTDISSFFFMDVGSGCSPIDVNFTDSSETPSDITSPIVSWNWDFGNGNTSTSQHPPTQTYTTGKYDVSLVVTTSNGCIDTLTLVNAIKVGDTINLGFEYSPTNTCASTGISFHDTSYISPSIDPLDLIWGWSFGDGLTSDFKNPSHKYADTGYMNIFHYVSYNGCISSIEKDSIVNLKAPIASFAIPLSETVICNNDFPASVSVEDFSILGAESDDYDMTWKWGDSSETYLSNNYLHNHSGGDTSHTYNSFNGSFINVWQIVKNYTTGCIDSLLSIVAVPDIHGSFHLNIDSVCSQGIVFIDADSSTSSAGIFSFSTSTHFYDAILDTAINFDTILLNPPFVFPHTFSHIGTHNIHLSIEDVYGCTEDTILPFVVLASPKADFEFNPAVGCQNYTPTIVNNSHAQWNGVGLANFYWTNLENGTDTITNSLNDTPHYTFNTLDSNFVSLWLTDQFGCISDTVTKAAIVTKPVANFAIDSVICNDIKYLVVNHSIGIDSLQNKWFIDGQMEDSSFNFYHNFHEDTSLLSVSHYIKLVVADSNGCKDSMEMSVLIDVPTADFTYQFGGAQVNAQGNFLCPPVFGTFQDSSFSIGNIVAWNWDFTDGNGSNLKDPANTYVFPGSYGTSLIITDEFGCMDTIIKDPIVKISGPMAHPSVFQPLDSCNNVVVLQLGQDSNVYHFDWDLGNGEHIYDSTANTYSYSSPGTYTSTLTITDSLGCKVVFDLDTITIIHNNLNAYFTVNPDQVTVGHPVLFTDQSTAPNDSIVLWIWNITGTDTTLYSSTSLSELYDTPGQYQISLIVKDSNACTDIYTKTITVKFPGVIFPNVITPNGDGTNDYFTFDIDIFKYYHIIILNRWGNLVHEGINQTGKVMWDGKKENGKPVNDGVYFYKFEGVVKDGSKLNKHGYIHVFN